MEMRHRIMGRVVAGHLEDAERLAEIWIREASEDVMSWLVLAEIHYLKKDFEQAREALLRAQEVDDFHPMYFRMVCLAARAVDEHKVAAVAFALAVFTGLPDLIAAHLCDLIEDDEVDEDEVPDPRWLALVEAQEEDDEEDWPPVRAEQALVIPPEPLLPFADLLRRLPKGARISGGSDFGNEWLWEPAPEEDDKG